MAADARSPAHCEAVEAVFEDTFDVDSIGADWTVSGDDSTASIEGGRLNLTIASVDGHGVVSSQASFSPSNLVLNALVSPPNFTYLQVRLAEDGGDSLAVRIEPGAVTVTRQSGAELDPATLSIDEVSYVGIQLGDQDAVYAGRSAAENDLVFADGLRTFSGLANVRLDFSAALLTDEAGSAYVESVDVGQCDP